MLDLSRWLFWGVATMAGVALGGTWAADRPYLLRLAPPQFVGEFYGLYAMVGRFASIIGPFLWGYVADTLGMGRPAAVLSLLVFIVIAFVILQGVDDHPRDWSGTERGRRAVERFSIIVRYSQSRAFRQSSNFHR